MRSHPAALPSTHASPPPSSSAPLVSPLYLAHIALVSRRPAAHFSLARLGPLAHCPPLACYPAPSLTPIDPTVRFCCIAIKCLSAIAQPPPPPLRPLDMTAHSHCVATPTPARFSNATALARAVSLSPASLPSSGNDMQESRSRSGVLG